MSEHAELPYGEQEPLVALRQALASESKESVQDLLGALQLGDAARAFLQLSADEQSWLLSHVEPDLAAHLLEIVPDQSAALAIEELEADAAAEILVELDSDDQADVLGEMDQRDADAILDQMAPEDSTQVRKLLDYDPGTAGGLMMTEVFKFLDTDTVAAVLRRVADADEGFERYRGQHPYVVAKSGALRGVVSLRSLLTSARRATLASIMHSPVAVQPDADLRRLRDIFDEYPFLGLPVVDDDHVLLGVVPRESVAEAELERAESEVRKLQGVVTEELRSMPTVLRARHRLSWLTINIFLNILAASIIALYEETLAAVIALAVFLPIVSDMSGCSGNQAVAVSLRELSLGIVKPTEVFKTWIKEASVGLINGLVLGFLAAVAAWLWKGNPYLGVVVGLALALNTMLAVSIGGTVPLILTKLRIDPAVASGPMLTTITDMAGFFFVLSIATIMMPLLL